MSQRTPLCDESNQPEGVRMVRIWCRGIASRPPQVTIPVETVPFVAEVNLDAEEWLCMWCSQAK